MRKKKEAEGNFFGVKLLIRNKNAHLTHIAYERNEIETITFLNARHLPLPVVTKKHSKFAAVIWFDLRWTAAAKSF